MSELKCLDIEVVYDDTLPCVNHKQNPYRPTTWHNHTGKEFTDCTSRYLKRNGQRFHKLDQRGVMANLGLLVRDPRGEYRKEEK